MSFSLNITAEKKNVAKALTLVEANPVSTNPDQAELVNAGKAAAVSLANGFPNGTVLSISISGHAAPRAKEGDPQAASSVAASVSELIKVDY
jgi:hypothetical protein